MATLFNRWRAAAVQSGATDPDATTAAGRDLLARWREPHRHYHTEAHLVAVLDHVNAYAGWASRPELVRIAAWCHDAVYDPRAAAGANERDSAALAGTLLGGVGLPSAAIAEVDRLVLLTIDHAPGAGDRDGALLCDADLAVLAGPPEEYDGYAAAIRQEYAHLPDGAFRAGRSMLLRQLLARPALFHLPPLAERWEAAARANVARELAALQA